MENVLSEFELWELMEQEFEGIFLVIFNLMFMDSIHGMLSIKTDKNSDMSPSVYKWTNLA